jgi:hypothetical protein
MRSLLFFLPLTASAATLTIGASRDNTLYEEVSGALSNGAGPTFFVGKTGGGGIRRGLIEFDLSAIPSGSMVESVSLTIFLEQAQSFPTDVTLHEVLAEWGEGASSAGVRGGIGAPATANDATWQHTFSTRSFWTNAGGDFQPIASATLEVGAEGSTYTWTSPLGLVADVQGWIDAPATNHGWLLRGDESQTGTAKAFATREASTAIHRPALTVTFTPVPEPGSVAVFLAGLIVLASRRRRTEGRGT